MAETTTNRITISEKVTPEYGGILTEGALEFIEKLQRKFNKRRKDLIQRRAERQKELDAGKKPDFLPQTEDIRNGDWTVAPLPDDLLDRRVEITGPVDRKMVINALNSGANVFMADFEDSNSPTWSNVIEGQINVRDAIRRTITYTNPVNNKFYKLNDEVATLLVRPRGWHMVEKSVQLEGEPFSASLFDFGLYFYHNAKELIASGSGPYFYLPKMESHLEARLWNDVFVFAQNELGIPQGTIKATVLIETILAAFEMDEILYELRNHSAGLNCGRWDYIFSFIKRFRKHPDFLLPDRSTVGMTRHFMRSYSLLAIKTCHKRNVHAMGGMAAQIPIKNDEAANNEALDKVRQDKVREVTDGHDGTWVAHPGLVKIAKDIFDENMTTPNQIHVKREDVNITKEDLLKVPEGDITEEGLLKNIDIGIQYLEAWLGGNGCVPIYNLMEDAATAEISRTQIWQWINNPNAKLNDGREIDIELYRSFVPRAIDRIKKAIGEENYQKGKFELAFELFEKLIDSKELEEFLTTRANSYI